MVFRMNRSLYGLK
jgi:hypothetical protein